MPAPGRRWRGCAKEGRMSREEQHFIDSIGRTGQGEADLQPVLAALRTWLAALGQAFDDAPLPAGGLQSASPWRAASLPCTKTGSTRPGAANSSGLPLPLRARWPSVSRAS
jgi:hypothetical protein